jgi:hypothetical protein
MTVKPQVVHLCFSDLTLSVARAPAHEESSLEMHVLHKQTRRSQSRRAGPMTGPPRLTLLRGGQHSATLAETAGDFNAAVLTVSCPTCNAKPQQPCGITVGRGRPPRRHHLRRADKVWREIRKR